jgi:Protein of unknown function (DUF3433)
LEELKISILPSEMEAHRTNAGGYAPTPTAELYGQQDSHYSYSYGSGGYPIEHPSQQYDNTYSWYSGYTGLSENLVEKRDMTNSSKAASTKTPRPQRPAHFYIPPILRLPSLLIVFLITLALIGAVEYGIQTLPHAQKTLHRDPKEIISSIIHQKRQTSTTSIGGSTTSTSTSKTPAAQVTGTTIPGFYAPTAISTSTVSTSTSIYFPTVVPDVTTGGYVPTQITVSTSVGGYVPTASAAGYVPTTTPGGTTTPGAEPVNSYVPTTSSVVYVAQTFTKSTEVPTTMVTTIAKTIVTTNSAGQAVTSVTYVPTTTTGLATVATTVVGAQAFSGSLFPMWTVFVGNYLPLVVVVIFRQFWTAIYSQVKLIEPFILLAQGRGVSAGAVLNSFYLSSNLTPDPVLALTRRHYFVLWASLIYIVVGLLGPVSSEVIFLDTNYTNCPFVAVNDKVNPCWPPRLSIDPVIGRIVEGLLSYIAVMTLTIMVMIWRNRTGIYSDPSAIASVTSLVHHPEVVQDFRMISEEASTRDVLQILGQKTYKLGEYQRSDGVWRYGIIPTVPGFTSYIGDKTAPKQPRPKSRRWRVLDFIGDALFLFALLALATVVVAYYKDGRDDGFNRFFNSRTFGPRFVLTGTGTLIALNWKRLERGMSTALNFAI